MHLMFLNVFLAPKNGSMILRVRLGTEEVHVVTDKYLEFNADSSTPLKDGVT